ncbi:MAG: aldehyde ferredoxin oxidoreductase family protein [Promethearchaeota archaeon]
MERKKEYYLKKNFAIEMLGGYKGKLLCVDLGHESFKTLDLPEEILNKYIGGRGLGAKLFWDLIPPKIDPVGEKNIFIILTGPLSGTIAPGAGKHLIITKSPASGGWLESYSSGKVASELKFAGYDGLIITSKAKNPILLCIKDNKVEFLDANNLWGKGAFETERFMKEKFDAGCGTLTIGPAGENLLPFACVGSDFFRKAGRGGAGAVMGSKNLKGIAIKGTGGIQCADLNTLREFVIKHRKRIRQRHMTPMTISITNAAGMLPTRNFSKGQFNKSIGTIDKDAVINVKVSDRACYACPAGCSNITKVNEGIFKGLLLEGPEYETLAMLGANLEIDYLPAIMKANYLCDDLGMDTISAGVVIGFVMECYERGLLSKEETGGLELKFGNYLAVIELLRLIAYKEGFGAFCAQGVKEMSIKLGKNSDEFAMHSKGLEMPAYDPRAGWGSAITYSVTPRGACHRRAWPPSVEILGGVNPFTIERKAEIVRNLMNARCILHTLILCDMLGPRMGLRMKDLARYLNVVIGSDYTEEDLNTRVEIIETLIRRINIREGFTDKDDILPKRILEENLPDGPGAGKVIGEENFLKMRSEYYISRGWDNKGIPTPELLNQFDYDNEPKIII